MQSCSQCLHLTCSPIGHCQWLWTFVRFHQAVILIFHQSHTVRTAPDNTSCIKLFKEDSQLINEYDFHPVKHSLFAFFLAHCIFCFSNLWMCKFRYQWMFLYVKPICFRWLEMVANAFSITSQVYVDILTIFWSSQFERMLRDDEIISWYGHFCSLSKTCEYILWR